VILCGGLGTRLREETEFKPKPMVEIGGKMRETHERMGVPTYFLREGLSGLSEHFILPEPAPGSDPSWFGFLLTVRENAGFTRDDMVAHLEKAGIQTRMLFAGNLIKHPCFDEMRSSGHGFRIVQSFSSPNSILHTLSFMLPTPNSQHTAPNSKLQTPNSKSPTPHLPTTDRIMRDTFWIGVYPGLTEEMINYIIENIKKSAKTPLRQSSENYEV